MYISTSRQANRPAAARPRVTAGLKWPPEIGPKAYAPIITVRPRAMATPKKPTPSGFPAPFPGKTAEKVAVPTRPNTRRNVPTVSAISRARVDGSAGAGASGYDIRAPHKKVHRGNRSAAVHRRCSIEKIVRRKHSGNSQVVPQYDSGRWPNRKDQTVDGCPGIR